MNKEILDKIFSDLSPKYNDIGEGEFTQITTNLQLAGKGDIVFYKINKIDSAYDLFVKRLGDNTDSLLVVNHACEKLLDRGNLICIDEKKFFKAQKRIADVLYPYDHSIRLVGVTGTNGKTTTVNVAMQISELNEKRAIAIGTIGITDSLGQVIEELGATTPSYIELRRILNQFSGKVDAIFLEVSSHALDQKRLGDLKLDSAAWTSFSQDHLDYHKTMEAYFVAKTEIFINHLKPNSHCYIPTSEHYLVDNLKKYENIVTAPIVDDEKLPPFFMPKYNRANLELALALNRAIWGNNICVPYEKIFTPKGRFSVIEIYKGYAVVDYAHTPDALSNVCSAIKEAFGEYHLAVVFGCGGDRDRAKRPLMAKATEEFADSIVVTSDNPRSEKPEDIIDDVVTGFTQAYHRECDRRKAIIYALENTPDRAIILVAGKGHEEYQEIDGNKIHFSDFEVIAEWKRSKDV